jgi:hypothetical protein
MSLIFKALRASYESRIAETLAHMKSRDDEDYCQLFPSAHRYTFDQLRSSYESVEHVAKREGDCSVAQVERLPVGVDGISYAAQLVNTHRGIALCDLSTSEAGNHSSKVTLHVN